MATRRVAWWTPGAEKTDGETAMMWSHAKDHLKPKKLEGCRRMQDVLFPRSGGHRAVRL